MRGVILCSLLSITAVRASFTPDFNAFLQSLYGVEAQRLLERLDFFEEGSFGGKSDANETIEQEPVVIVHGITNMASRFFQTRNYLKTMGYSDAEIYATTYGGGPDSFLFFITLKCQYIKQVRALIMAVYQYTGRQIDVIAYSMGSPIARAAILGGYCDRENLGLPLTHMVDTFMSVAGANYGSALCVLPLAVCNSDDGLHCSSRILKNLNERKERYEGTYSFSIYSNADDKVGVHCCGHVCSDLPYANDVFKLKEMGHDQLMDDSIPLQYELITKHRPSDEYLDKFKWTSADEDKSRFTLFRFLF